MIKDFILEIPYTEFKFQEYSKSINLDADFVKDVEYVTNDWSYRCNYQYDECKKTLWYSIPKFNMKFDTIKITYISKSQQRDEKINQIIENI